MTATFQATGDVPAPTMVQRLWQRQLHRYPNNGVRYTSLAIVVATTVILYYQQYLAGGIATSVLKDTNMSFTYYVNITVVASIFGSLASLVAGLADRYGRANIVTLGLGVASLMTLFAFPEAHNKMTFAVLACVVGFIEGIVLVATPALIRDFSPQLGRASAMGFWTLGPVLGSLMVSGIVTPTFKGHRATTAFGWGWEYRVAGVISLVVFAIALIGLRELSPALRDQLMVSEKDRALIEMRAKGLDVEKSLQKPFRQMMRVDILASAFAISVFLIIYYIAVGFFPIFFETVHGYSASKANGLGNWIWAFDALALVVIGYASDKVRVRKPFMIVGGLASIAFTTLFALKSTDGSNPSHTWYVVVLVCMAVSLGVAYAPWMASFTETAEKHNPALTATGLAVWGMTIRIVIAVAVFIAPHIVNTVTTIIEKGGTIQAYEADPTPIQTAAGNTTVGAVTTAVVANSALVGQISAQGAQYGAQLATAAKIDSATAAALGADPTGSTPAGQAAAVKALSEISGLPEADVATVATLSATKPGALAAGAVIDSATAATLLATPTDAAAQAKAVGEIVAGLHVTQAQAVADLTELGTIPVAQLLTVKADAAAITAATTALKSVATIPAATVTLFSKTAPAALGAANFAALTATTQNPELKTALAYLTANGADVAKASAKSPHQWRNYFWVAIGGEIVFIPMVFLMAGYWSPKKAKKAEQEHEAMVAAEMAKLQGSKA